jgi:outer membrane protein assembly factor BamB
VFLRLFGIETILMKIACALVGCLLIAVAWPAPLWSEESSWRKLPPLPGRTDSSGRIALEGDTLWAAGGNSVSYWTGSAWRIPTGPLLKTAGHIADFKAGPAGQLFLAQWRSGGERGELYQLQSGEASLLTTFRVDPPPGGRPALRISPGGLVHTMDREGISVFHNGEWQTTPRPAQLSALFETPDGVYFYDASARQMVSFDAKAGFRRYEVELTLRRKVAGGLYAVRWGVDRALVIDPSQGLLGIELATGKKCDVGQFAEVIGKRRPTALFQRRDGSVWVLCLTPGEKIHPVFRLGADGQCTRVVELDDIVWRSRSFGFFPPEIMEARDGAVWIAGQQETLTRIDGGRATRFGTESGYNLGVCQQVIEDSRGAIYAVNQRGIYVWSSSSSVASQLPAPRIPTRPEATWIYRREKEPPLLHAWKPGKVVYAVGRNPQGRGHQLVAIDTATGKKLYAAPLAPQDHSPPWFFRGGENGALEFSIQSKVVRLSAESGLLREEIELPHDERISPIPLADGYLVVPKNRGTDLVRVDRAQQPVWKTPLPGYVMMHPTVIGKQVVLQTRSNDYGGQQTVCIRLADGTIAWQDETNAYGCGIDYFDDERFLVEANQHMNPQIGEGWLIARNPATGQRLWEYRLSGLMNHPPLVDRRTGRVYAVSRRGEVVCLRGEDGSVVWTERLSENAFGGGGANSYDEAWSPHSLVDGRLLIVDDALTLHVIDPATGKFQASLALVPQLDPASPTPVQLAAPPWVDGDAVCVALSEGVISFKLPASTLPANKR